MNKKAIFIAFVLSAAACCSVLYMRYEGSEVLNRAYGNVDIRQSTLSFERSGRITELLYDEGDHVKKDSVMARLDTADLDHQIAIAKTQEQESSALLDEMLNGYRAQEITQAKASVERLKHSYALAKLTNDRYQKLYRSHNVSAQDRDQAYYSMSEIKAQLDEALAKYDMMRAGYRQEDIQKARAQHDNALSKIQYLSYQKEQQSVIKAPFDGVVRSRKNEIGDMSTPQSGVYELSLIEKKRVRVYLTEKQLVLSKIGNSAQVITSNGDHITGKIAYISDTAMFTPKTVQTEDLRADLVYEVRVDVDDTDNILRLGQSVTVDFQDE